MTFVIVNLDGERVVCKLRGELCPSPESGAYDA